MARVVNSRIRLLLLCIVVSFGVLLARSAWIATVQASSLSSFAQAQTKAMERLEQFNAMQQIGEFERQEGRPQ